MPGYLIPLLYPGNDIITFWYHPQKPSRMLTCRRPGITAAAGTGGSPPSQSFILRELKINHSGGVHTTLQYTLSSAALSFRTSDA